MNLSDLKNLQTTMTRILFIQPDGREQAVETKPGQ